MLDILNNFIIFDWDDTLMATTTFKLSNICLNCNINVIPSDLLNKFNELSEKVLSILEKSIKNYKVVIITNSDEGWVELSSQKLMPNVYNFIYDNNIDIISAKLKYSDKIKSSIEWKILAFEDEINSLGNVSVNVISFGDSICERIALQNLNNSNIVLKKNIKFIEKPKINQIINQLILIDNYFEFIINESNNLDLMLTLSIIK
jgi:hypothetical protein